MPQQIEELESSSPPYFWWLLVNLLALSFAVLSWIFCLEVFGHPESPRNYEILRKLGRLPEFKNFKFATLPDGSLSEPEQLYRKFFGLNEGQYEDLNIQFRHNFLSNFEEPAGVNYIEGDYRVLEVRAFDQHDFLIEGFAVRAQAMVKPDDFSEAGPYPVVIEYLFPTADPTAAGRFKPGDLLTLQKGPHCGTVIYVGKHLEGDELVVRLTIMPIAYGPCHMGGGRPFELQVPEILRPAGVFPVF